MPETNSTTKRHARPAADRRRGARPSEARTNFDLARCPAPTDDTGRHERRGDDADLAERFARQGRRRPGPPARGRGDHADEVRRLPLPGSGLADRLRARARMLAPEDRLLVEAVFEAGDSPAALARRLGLHHATVRRRIRTVLRHLSDPRFAFVMVHLGEWPPDRARVARLRFLERCPLREIVERTGLSMHEVRRHADAVQSQWDLHRD